ncbi:MAG: P-type conjugative transfer protein TrbL, partial [Terriglobales bacterium]
MKLKHRSLLVLSALVIATGALAYGQTPAPQSGPSDLLDVYKNATTTWVSTAFGYANKLFGLLAVIDFTWAMIVLFLERHELEGWIAGFLKKFMTISFFYALLINQSTWFPAIINSFVQIGQQAGGVSGYLNPSTILWTGVQISGAILAACLPSASASSTVGGIVGVIVPGAGAALTAASLIPALVALFCALLIFLAYVVITLTFIMATVESYVVMSAGLIFLGFGASRWTVPYTERYISLVVSTGVRLMVLYMIIGLGQTLSNTWVQEASQIALSTAGLQSLFGLLASVIVFMALAWQVPKLASSVLQGSLQMGSSDLIAPAMSAAVVAGTIGAVATAGVGAVAGGVGLLGAGGAAAAGGGAGAAGGDSGAGGSFLPGAAGGMMPGMGSTMAGGGGSGAAPGVEGAMNSVPPPAPSAGGGGGDAVAVDPPPISVAADSSPTPGQSAEGSSAGTGVGESATTGSSVTVPTQGKTTRVADAGEAISAGGDSTSGPVADGSVSASGATPTSLPASEDSSSAATGEASLSGESPAASPGVVTEAPLGAVSPAEEETSSARSRSDGRSLGEKISGLHNAAAQAHQHLPQDSATVSAPTLNIQHGE